MTNEDAKGVIILGAVGAILVGVFSIIALNRDAAPSPDHCRERVTRATVIVLDRTDSVADQTRAEIVARVMRIVEDSAHENERVSVFTVTALSKRHLTPEISVCRPVSSGNVVTQDVNKVRADFVRLFEQPIREIVQTAPTFSVESPIAQALTDISLTAFLQADTNRLVVFSDMVEHTSFFSLYRCQNAKEVIQDYRASRTGAVERPTFRNTFVELHLIPRLGLRASTVRCRNALWPWFFGDDPGPTAGLSWSYLPGSNPLGGTH